MNVQFTHQSTLSGSKQMVSAYFHHFQNLPRQVIHYEMALAFLYVGLFWQGGEAFRFLCVVLAIVYLIITPLQFLFYWRNTLPALKKAKVFELPMTCTLTDDHIQMERGGNTSKTMFRDNVSAFFIKKDLLIMLNGKILAGAISREMLPSDEAFQELQETLKKAGAKDVSHLTWKKWFFPVLLGVLLALTYGALVCDRDSCSREVFLQESSSSVENVVE